jgi:hypothetical protein
LILERLNRVNVTSIGTSVDVFNSLQPVDTPVWERKVKSKPTNPCELPRVGNVSVHSLPQQPRYHPAAIEKREPAAHSHLASPTPSPVLVPAPPRPSPWILQPISTLLVSIPQDRSLIRGTPAAAGKRFQPSIAPPCLLLGTADAFG